MNLQTNINSFRYSGYGGDNSWNPKNFIINIYSLLSKFNYHS